VNCMEDPLLAKLTQERWRVRHIFGACYDSPLPYPR
jgi:hypothetical protein